jgi:hypothetical protein
VPLSFTVCGLPPPLSVKLKIAVRSPVAAGLKVRVATQLPPAARVCRHVSDTTLKSALSAPALLIPVMLTAVAPVLVTVTVCGELTLPTFTDPKLRLPGTNCITVPVPASGTDCGLPGALSETETSAERLPGATGSKVTVMVQLAPAFKPDPHVLLWLKSPAFEPPMLMLVMVNPVTPLFVRVTASPGLALFTNCVANVRLKGEN